MPRPAASSAARTARSIDSRETPGKEAHRLARGPSPSRMKIGQIRLSTPSRTSAAISRTQGCGADGAAGRAGKGAVGVMAQASLGWASVWHAPSVLSRRVGVHDPDRRRIDAPGAPGQLGPARVGANGDSLVRIFASAGFDSVWYWVLHVVVSDARLQPHARRAP